VHTIRTHRHLDVREIAVPGPVVLATLSARVEQDAERLAIASCLEAGVPLVVANVVPAPLSPRTLQLGALDPDREDYAAVRATAERAAKLGIRVEHLRVMSPRPAKAIVEIANERGAGLLVLGPKRGRVPRRRLRRAAREVRRSAACLIWIAGD
jgi:nucleotide-binding universal stress UspA family protein